MSVGAAIRITSVNEERVIRHAVAFAAQQQVTCFVLSVVHKLPYGAATDEERDVVRRNLALIAELQASPVMQEGDDVVKTLRATAYGFGVQTLFLQSGTSRLLGRSIAEQLIYLDPPFDVVIVSSE